MDIIKKVEVEIIRAMKEKKEIELSTLRMIKSALKNAEIAKRPAKLTDDDEIKVLKNETKKHLDSIELFTRGNRPDLVKKEEAELEIIKKYLPEELSDSALKKIIQKAVNRVGAQGPKDFGKAMGAVMKEVAGKADGGRVGTILKEILEKKK